MKVITIESDYINGDSGSLSDYMCSIVETLCVIKKKLGYFLHVTDFLRFDLAVNFLYFLSNSVHL